VTPRRPESVELEQEVLASELLGGHGDDVMYGGRGKSGMTPRRPESVELEQKVQGVGTARPL